MSQPYWKRSLSWFTVLRKKLSLFVLILAAGLVVLVACSDNVPTIAGSNLTPPTGSSIERELQRVEDIHGGAGPWAVLGYRMGKRALAELGLQAEIPHTSQNRFVIDVVHFAPRQIQFTSMVDGLHAGTGASLGKMNLALEMVPSIEQMRSTVRSRQTGRLVEFRVQPSFIERYLEIPLPQLVAAGREVIQLADQELFNVVVTDQP